MSVYPGSWKTMQLDEVAQVQTGMSKSANRSTENVITLPYLRVANVQDGRVDLTELKTIEVPRDKVERYSVRLGDILLTEGGDFDKLGRGCVWQGQVERCVHQNHIFVVRPDKKRLLPEFLSLLCASRYGRTYFISCAKQTTNLASINSSQLKEFPLLVPPLEEQKSICAAIQHWDHTIGLTERLLTEKRLRRKGLMQQLLTGKRRLPGFAGEWRKVRLGDILHTRTESGRTDLPLVSIAADRGVIPRDEVDRKDSSSEDKSKYLRICPGDIGYNTMRMWQGVSGLSSVEGIVSPAYTIVTPRMDIDGEFMAILFKFQPVVHLFYRHSQGMVSDTWNLKFRHFAKIKVTIPDEDEQKAIARIFHSIDRELELLQTKASALREQKKGLMQQLLTGKKRVKV